MADERIIWLAVPFSESEFRGLRGKRALTRDGTTWNVVRERLEMQARPMRFEALPHKLVKEGVPWRLTDA